MNELKKILHIDSKWVVNYILVRERTFMKTLVPLEKALKMLRDEEFDLILAEPYHRAILKSPKGNIRLNPADWIQ